MELRKIVTKTSRLTRAKLFNRDILKIAAYEPAKNIDTSGVIFFDDQTVIPLTFSHSPDNWAIVSDTLAEKFSNFDYQNKIIHFEAKNYRPLLTNAEFVQNVKREIPFVLKKLTLAYLRLNKLIATHYNSDIQNAVLEIIEKIKFDIDQNQIDVFSKQSVILYIRQQIKFITAPKKIIMPATNYFRSKKRTFEDAFKLKNEGKLSINDICEICRISRSALKNKLKEHDLNIRHSNTSENTKVLRSYLLSDEITFLKSLADKHEKSFTVREMAEMFESRFNFSIPENTIRYHLKNSLKYSRKKSHFKNFSAFTQEHGFTKFDVCKNLVQALYEGKNVFFIDEASATSDIDRHYSYSKIGTTSYKCRQPIFKQLNILMAITHNQVFCYTLRRGTFNEISFIAFLIKLVEKIISFGDEYSKNSFLFLDNVSFHKSKIVKKFYNLIPISVIFNATYSPEFNPIESAFAGLKQEIRAHNQRNL